MKPMKSILRNHLNISSRILLEGSVVGFNRPCCLQLNFDFGFNQIGFKCTPKSRQSVCFLASLWSILKIRTTGAKHRQYTVDISALPPK